MANSQPISDLSAYGANERFEDSDLFIVSSKKDDNTSYKSYKVTYSELYGAIKKKLSAEIMDNIKQLTVMTTLEEAMAADSADQTKCAGPGVIKELSSQISSMFDDCIVPKWQPDNVQ